MKKGIYFSLLLLACCWFSCGTPNQEAQEGETTTTVQEETTANATSTEATDTPTEVGNSKITEAIVGKVCDCKKEAKKEDGTPDVEQIRACMGAASSTEYVKNLLGPSATDKELTDALNELMEKTKDC